MYYSLLCLLSYLKLLLLEASAPLAVQKGIAKRGLFLNRFHKHSPSFQWLLKKIYKKGAGESHCLISMTFQERKKYIEINYTGQKRESC